MEIMKWKKKAEDVQEQLSDKNAKLKESNS